MSAKPSTLPQWATAGDVVEPTSGKKAQGFYGGEQPVAEYVNWLFNLLYQWIVYVDDPDKIRIGQDYDDTETEALDARVTLDVAANATATYTLLFSFANIRVWSRADDNSLAGAFVITSNATRSAGNSGKWEKIADDENAFIVVFDRMGITTGAMPNDQNTDWSDAFVDTEGTSSGWGRQFLYSTNSDDENASDADKAIASQVMPETSGVERKLLFRFRHATLGTVRFYYSIDTTNTDANGLEIVCNASWGNSGNLWTVDTTGSVVLLLLSSIRLRARTKVGLSAGNTFADNAWSFTPLNIVWPTALSGSGNGSKIELNNGVLQIVNPENGGAEDANPPSTAAVAKNSLCAKNITKAHAQVLEQTTGPTVIDGYNIASVSHDTSAETITVTFATAISALATVNVTCSVVTGSTDFLIPQIVSQTSTTVVLKFMRVPVGGGSAAVANLGSAEFVFYLTVLGTQT